MVYCFPRVYAHNCIIMYVYLNNARHMYILLLYSIHQYTVCVIYSWWFLTWDDLRTQKIYCIPFIVVQSITNSFSRPLDRWIYIDWTVPSTQTPFQLQSMWHVHGKMIYPNISRCSFIKQKLNQHLHPLNNVYLQKSTTKNMTSSPAPVWDLYI